MNNSKKSGQDSIQKRLIEKIKTHDATVGVVGLGYVGLPFAIEKAKVGFSVVGIERLAKRVDAVNEGLNYIADVDNEELRSLVNKGGLRAVTSFEIVPELDIIVICVPTPLTPNLTPDLRYIEDVTRKIAERLRAGQFISLESTTYPGTTEEVMLPILTATGMNPGTDFFLAHSPERVDPGNARYTTRNTNKVVGAIDPASLEVAVTFYNQTIEHVVPVSSAKAAELVKVFENTFRAVNIALVNELALLCDRIDLNVWEVLEAAFTKPFGILPFYPGPGVGGHCIPIDPHYLEWKAKEFNFNTRFIALAGETNRHMPEFVREKVNRALNRVGVSPSSSSILILGVSYKRDLSDSRESPAFSLMRLLREDGAKLTYHDPYIPEVAEEDISLSSVDLTDERIEGADVVVIIADHTCIDYGRVVEKAKAVVDTRNATRDVPQREEKVILL